MISELAIKQVVIGVVWSILCPFQNLIIHTMSIGIIFFPKSFKWIEKFGYAYNNEQSLAISQILHGMFEALPQFQLQLYIFLCGYHQGSHILLAITILTSWLSLVKIGFEVNNPFWDKFNLQYPNRISYSITLLPYIAVCVAFRCLAVAFIFVNIKMWGILAILAVVLFNMTVSSVSLPPQVGCMHIVLTFCISLCVMTPYPHFFMINQQNYRTANEVGNVVILSVATIAIMTIQPSLPAQSMLQNGHTLLILGTSIIGLGILSLCFYIIHSRISVNKCHHLMLYITYLQDLTASYDGVKKIYEQNGFLDNASITTVVQSVRVFVKSIEDEDLEKLEEESVQQLETLINWMIDDFIEIMLKKADRASERSSKLETMIWKTKYELVELQDKILQVPSGFDGTIRDYSILVYQENDVFITL